jgi:UDP-N-acetylmuramoylalanine-D-glutamate ligase
MRRPAARISASARVAASPGWRSERLLLPLATLPLAGLHNAANAMAALALCAALGIDAQALLPALQSFRGLPHRVEKIAEIDGVTWYDDSKGTNVGATVAALEGLGGMNDRKVVVILGGDGKAQDFSPLRDAVARHGRAAILIGRDAPDRQGNRDRRQFRSMPPPTWRPCVARPRWRSRAMRCCCRRPAPASTCSAVTSIAPRCSPPRCAAGSGKR